jgi:hypothetical protein
MFFIGKMVLGGFIKAYKIPPALLFQGGSFKGFPDEH